jgi:hypothetical protein
MTYTLKDGSGSLFPNDKRGNDRAPAWRGDLMIDGRVYEIAGWDKQGKRGEFISLSAKPKENRPKPAIKPTVQRTEPKGIADMSDDIPF